MSIRWIFFDVGYTLFDETAVWERRFEEQAQLEETQKRGLTAADVRAAVENATRSRLPQYRTFVRTHQLTQAAPYRHELETPYPDALPVLKQLSQSYRLGVIANQTAGLEDRLRAWGLLPHLSAVVSSWEHQIMKPDVRLFEAALREACCTPGEAAMVGDRLDNDVQPAKALGMHTVWIRQGFGALQSPLSPADTPDHVIDSLSDLLPLVDPKGACS